MTATMTAGFTQAALLSYVGGSSFVFMTLHGASPLLLQRDLREQTRSRSSAAPSSTAS